MNKDIIGVRFLAMSHKTRSILECLLAALLFGAAAPASKLLLGHGSPFVLAGLLYLGAAGGVLPFAFHGGAPGLRRERRNLQNLAGAIFFGGIAGPVFLMFGLARAAAADVSLWLNLEAVLTAFVAGIWFREYLGSRIWISALLVVTAGIWLASPQSAGSLDAAMLVTAACFCWALDNNFTSLVDGYTPAQSTLAKGLVAGSVNLGIGAVIEGYGFGLAESAAALVVGAFSYGASLMLYVAGAQQLGATRSQMLFAVAPFAGVVLSWTAVGEPVTSGQIGAMLLMGVGLSFMLTSKHKHEHTHEAMTHTHSHRHDDGHHSHSHEGLPPWTRHTHPHNHEPMVHSHEHGSDLHHRHRH